MVILYEKGLSASAKPRDGEVAGSIPGRDRLKSLTLVVVAFPLGAEDYGYNTTNGPPVSG